MREVIRRRYSQVMQDGLTPPDLIVIDGGQGQVNIALSRCIQEELGLDIPIAGLQRASKHQTMNLSLAILSKSSNSGPPVLGIFPPPTDQDEVHRFAITFHRQLRSRIPSLLSWTESKAWDQSIAVA